MFNSKIFLAEFIGTFALVFVGMSAGIVNAGLVGIALASGFTLAVFFYAYGHISGTHLNPAVTFGLALNGTVKWIQLVFYWIAQFAGAILAVFFLKTLVESLGADASGMATAGALTEPQPILAMVVVAVLTFFLVNTYLHTAVAGNGGVFAGWAIGATLSFCDSGCASVYRRFVQSCAHSCLCHFCWTKPYQCLYLCDLFLWTVARGNARGDCVQFSKWRTRRNGGNRRR